MAEMQVKRKIGVSPCARISTNLPSRPSSPTKPTRPPSPFKRVPAQAPASHSLQPRPRAKVSSSANIAVGKKTASTLSPALTSASSSPREPSPVRRYESQPGRLSPKPDAIRMSRARSAGLPAASASTSPRVGNVQADYAALSAATSDSALAKPSPPRIRQASISSVSQLSSTSSPNMNGICSPPLSAVSHSHDSDAQSTVSSHRITAKVSSVAKAKQQAQPQPFPSSSPLLAPSPIPGPSTSEDPLSRGPQLRQRVCRTVSIGSLSAPRASQVYPITTANPAANAHRFATVRSPSSSHRPSHVFTSPLQSEHRPRFEDPASVPPLSPPTSNVSFSSLSSVSRSSGSSAYNTTAPGSRSNGIGTSKEPTNHNARNGLNAPGKSRSTSLDINDADLDRIQPGDSPQIDTDGAGEECATRAEAKSHRKIADLEITNKSLLAINSQLEANKHKQAKEIRELRLKLRESQLALPPRAYRELKAAGAVEELDKEEDEPEEQEVDGDEDVRTTAEAIRLGKDDELFDRVRIIIDGLLTSGRQALAVKVEDLAPPKGAAKVLHEVEARTWRDGFLDTRSGTATPGAADTTEDISFDESFLSVDSGDEGVSTQNVTDSSFFSYNNNRSSEREVEDLVSFSTSISS
ncbi:uncharacterized protein FOMMEDRAFT_167132 [Fomitiporia mediterranea MF3/22]|uniref:uncharacterized protein n=1 Tax=Fomitiporia mediterranea (strain MF3/22) TaxID=694068 RepID=UPI00044091FB|nr:uncharacterized protein FOMMEDRAFT_167132 [Fomitiporia mediterranea MF3/22]EJD03815.1 hypothetical protein FOMMEDRAFT_167132 [Fomitiporia mediterranea MF3/22]